MAMKVLFFIALTTLAISVHAAPSPQSAKHTVSPALAADNFWDPIPNMNQNKIPRPSDQDVDNHDTTSRTDSTSVDAPISDSGDISSLDKCEDPSSAHSTEPPFDDLIHSLNGGLIIPLTSGSTSSSASCASPPDAHGADIPSTHSLISAGGVNPPSVWDARSPSSDVNTPSLRDTDAPSINGIDIPLTHGPIDGAHPSTAGSANSPSTTDKMPPFPHGTDLPSINSTDIPSTNSPAGGSMPPSPHNTGIHSDNGTDIPSTISQASGKTTPTAVSHPPAANGQPLPSMVNSNATFVYPTSTSDTPSAGTLASATDTTFPSATTDGAIVM